MQCNVHEIFYTLLIFMDYKLVWPQALGENRRQDPNCLLWTINYLENVETQRSMKVPFRKEHMMGVTAGQRRMQVAGECRYGPAGGAHVTGLTSQHDPPQSPFWFSTTDNFDQEDLFRLCGLVGTDYVHHADGHEFKSRLKRKLSNLPH